MSRVEEANKTEAEGLSHLQKKRGKFDQELSGSSIYEEERVLRLMEEQEIPVRSGKRVLIHSSKEELYCQK